MTTPIIPSNITKEPAPALFTASNVLLQTLVDAGITHCFVNLGSDHPSLLEAFIQRTKDGAKSVKIVTCPNEMVALSCAQGYAQVCGKPAAVIVHVDCGTQALAGVVHNVCACRTPVLIYAGASPFSQEGEHAGSRNEFIHYLQNAVDQPQIVRQYMRHVGEIRSGATAQHVLFRAGMRSLQTILRGLQFAMSEPKGPVYLWAMREVTEERLDPKSIKDVRASEVWTPIEPSPLGPNAVKRIAESLAKAKKPLFISTYAGRNPSSVEPLTRLAELTASPVFSSCPSTVNLDFDHYLHAGVNFGQHNPLVEPADFILILDCDVPWLALHTKPSRSAEIFHIDCDPLKEKMLAYSYPALLRAKADVGLACQQLIDYLSSPNSALDSTLIEERRSEWKQKKQQRDAELLSLETPGKGDLLTAPLIVASLRKNSNPEKTLVCNEAISNYPHVWNHFKPRVPGSLLSSGASSLGWSLGAAIGAKFAGDADSSFEKDLIAVVVGDGSFVFGVPSASYWISRRYDAPFLTIVLNNGGWKSPTLSMIGVHPNGLGSRSTAGDLNVSFGPTDDLNPDYGAIAQASGGAWCAKVKYAHELEEKMKEAIRVVKEEKRSAVLDCWLERF
ncbi:BZ3500_MvSof-1268-A1-R1_Chr11-1g03269 [Microbotryum saponariae]|uniref:BZ3500_MvSof-1268-A1-R1_Chr11-1g03269 protein n=1 Tax=Microbotryum saponariae TaxID=289078 RepID=A0A2X0LFX9_9BASI|nr:BZ3501_MvSof-1269-A2-R1_Chr11g02844 [Microbotryum saponariae]SDA03848.1 BZ3500_MvSof-1268-A1-R1_Chr11-1g03269 [Microbotryum saponariae]